MINETSEYAKVLNVLRKSKSVSLIELSVLCDIDEAQLQTIVEALESKKLVRIANRGNPLDEIVTLREVAFAAGAAI